MKHSTLKDLLQGTQVLNKRLPDIDVSSMTLDSREVSDGCLFIALRGLHVHGLSFAMTAQRAGAVAVLWDVDERVSVPELDIPLIGIENLAAKLGSLASRLYDYRPNQLSTIGITGTDGKTSVSHFLAQAMNASGDSCSVIGTLGIGRPEALEKATHTTPDVISVHKSLKQISSQGCRYVAMEVSSHALDQQRVAGVNFDAVVLTNLTRDHLDYHGTVAAYAEAKSRLFLEGNPKAAVINLDDEFGLQLVQTLAKTNGATTVYGYGRGKSDHYPENAIIATNARFNHQGLQADVTYLGEKYRLEAGVLGDFNLSNLLAAIGTLIALGYKPVEAVAMLSKVATVPGRIEKVEHSHAQRFLGVVDYAHTPGAIESVLKALRAHCSGRLICVFGCGGDRDAGKRPLMAAAAERLADLVIITDDNPRSEDPLSIVQDVLRGLERPNAVIVEHNRAAAIRKAVMQAGSGDVVLVAGKGHEQFQLIQGESLVFDDREQLSQAIDEISGRAVA